MNTTSSTGNKLIPALSLVYLSIPLLLFLSSWIKLAISVPLILLLLYSLIQTYRNAEPLQLESLQFKGKIVIILSVLLLWVVLSGIGGLVWQNRWDHMFRNALFRDLVRYDWPVIDTGYGPERILCYNLGFWLPSALIGKVFGLQVGYIAQLIWAFAGIVLAFYLVCEQIRNVRISIAIIFILFSGLDIILFLIGKVHSHSLKTALFDLLRGSHLELKLYQFSSSSNTTLLFWVYNQAIAFWITFTLLLRQKNNKSRLFVFMLMLLYAPFPAIGSLPLLIYQFFQKSNFITHAGSSSFDAFLRNTLTIPNIAGFIVCALLSLFYMSNIATGSLGTIAITKDSIIEFSLYIATEFLVYLVIIVLYRKADTTYWILMGTMALFSFISLGNNYDFGWRTCIPATFYTMLLITKIIVNPAPAPTLRFKRLKAILLILLVLGSITPIMEVLRTVENTSAYYAGTSTEPLMSNTLDSVFDQKNNQCYDNFIGVTDSFFAEYFLVKQR